MKNNLTDVLFTKEDQAISPEKIQEQIRNFGYNKAVVSIIEDSTGLDVNGDMFIKCAARILINFKMTRSGPFKGLLISKDGSVYHKELLLKCWLKIGDYILNLRNSINKSGLLRDRYLLELNKSELERLIDQIWSITKQILPYTMSHHSYGLVGASKILFSVLPEIVLPVDNIQWLRVFKTVDLGDVIRQMIAEVEVWEKLTGEKLNEMCDSNALTTLPSVYNVMAMAARDRVPR
ncbi:MAG: hypothetical protein PHU23_09295 [Dehalococcoidales bacterium]|nr:hypothetical protein [Dehalococcoidales bacterium]